MSMLPPPHEVDLIGTDVVDYEARVDIDRLKAERLARIRAEMARADLDCLLLYDPVNIRYATGSRKSGAYYHRLYTRYALVPREGEPALVPVDWGQPGILPQRLPLGWDFFVCGSRLPEAVALWAEDIVDGMKALGAAGGSLGIDRLDYPAFAALQEKNLRLADARVPLERARAVKTPDELVLMRQACAVADVAVCKVQDAIRPGVTENELFAILAGTNLALGGEHMDSKLLTAGAHTNPWYRQAGSRMVRAGDLVAFDTDMAGPMNYFADISRTYLCGDTRPTPEQREAYRLAYDFLQQALPLFRVGIDFREIAEKVPDWPEDYRAGRYVVIAHGDGMSDEWPTIYYKDAGWAPFGNEAAVLEENMVLSVEALAAKRGALEAVKLEEQIIIGRNAPEVISRAPFDWRLLG
jgi:Xaa-Pro dipeptidase